MLLILITHIFLILILSKPPTILTFVLTQKTESLQDSPRAGLLPWSRTFGEVVTSFLGRGGLCSQVEQSIFQVSFQKHPFFVFWRCQQITSEMIHRKLLIVILN